MHELWTGVILILAISAVWGVNSARPTKPSSTRRYVTSHPMEDKGMIAKGCRLSKQIKTAFRKTRGGLVNSVWDCPITALITQSYPPANESSPASTPRRGADPADMRMHKQESAADVKLTTFLPWQLDRASQRSSAIDGVYTPIGLVAPSLRRVTHVYVVDSGIQASHPIFADVTVRLDFPSALGAGDCDGHGTFVASEIAGHVVGVLGSGHSTDANRNSASGLVLHSIRVLGCSGEGDLLTLLQGLSYIQNYGVPGSIITMSLSASGRSAQLDGFLAALIADGDFEVVVAGGNVRDDACNYSPAALAPLVTSVGAIQLGDRRASYSNYGSCISIFAPGTDCWGAIINTPGIGTMSGTSQATPLVTATMALRMLNGTSTAKQAKAWIFSRATRNVLHEVGSGSPNILLFNGPDTTSAPSPPPTVPTFTHPPPPSSTSTLSPFITPPVPDDVEITAPEPELETPPNRESGSALSASTEQQSSFILWISVPFAFAIFAL